MSVLWYPKDQGYPQDGEDSACCDEQLRLAAVADGASASFESRGWSRHIIGCFAAFPPDSLDKAGIGRWIAQVQRSWKAAEPVRRGMRPAVPRFVVDQADPPSGATLAAIRVGSGGAPRFAGVAVGDACVFQVRGNRPILCAPLASSADFGSHPDLIRTDGPAPPATYLRGTLEPGDSVFLATDAFAEWLIARRDDTAVWAGLDHTDQAGFNQLVEAQRSAGAMVIDDVTLVRCCLLDPEAAEPAGAEGTGG
jgi:hypothetical protein